MPRVRTFSDGELVSDVPSMTPEQDALTANQREVYRQLNVALARMQQIIDAPQISFTTVAQAQTQVRQLQTAVVDEARLLRRVVRSLRNDYTGTD